MRLRSTVAAVLLLITGMFLQARTAQMDAAAARNALSALPARIGEWSGKDLQIDPEVRRVLGEGDFLQRVYRSENGDQIDLFVAYMPHQSGGTALHRPKNCFPGAGWTPVSFAKTSLWYRGKLVDVNADVLRNAEQRVVVLYWYQAHSRIVASEYSAKAYLMMDAWRLKRTDGALVRIIAPVEGEMISAGGERAASFAQSVLPVS